MKKMQIIWMAILLAAASGYSALVSDDFESYTAGTAPTATRVSGTTTDGTGENFITVVGSGVNTAGTGNGVEIKDNNTSSTGLEWEYGTDVSAIKFEFGFSAVSLTTGNSAYMTFGVGQDGVTSLGSGSSRYAEGRLYDGGRVRLYAGGSYVNIDSIATAGETHTLTMYANDYDSQTVNYTVGATDYTLGANSVAWWFDGSMVLVGGSEYGDLDLGDATDTGTVGTTEGNLNRVGMITSTSKVGLDYVFDNVSVNVIPEPATVGMLGLGALLMVAVRRLRG